MILISTQISKHFHSTEFKCPHCNNIKIDENLVFKMEHIFDKLHASKCIISSGYRCPSYDTQIGGFVGRHAEGLAADCCYYDKNGKQIPSQIVSCVTWDLGELNGIAPTSTPYWVHLDNRQNGYYHGDEAKGNDNFWTNPYTYFGVSKSDVAKYTGESVSNDYRTLYNMNVRSGAGDNHHIKRVKELTADGKKHALYTGDDDFAIYKKGTVFTALEIIDNEYGKWAKTPSGYVCIKGSDGITYSEKI